MDFKLIYLLPIIALSTGCSQNITAETSNSNEQFENISKQLNESNLKNEYLLKDNSNLIIENKKTESTVSNLKVEISALRNEKNKYSDEITLLKDEIEDLEQNLITIENEKATTYTDAHNIKNHEIEEESLYEEEPLYNEEVFANCTELRQVYPYGVDSSHPAYQSKMDRDKDGWACER